MRRAIDESARVYGAGVLIRHLDAFEGEIEGVRQARDIECIHRMRVASRRVRSALTLFWDYLPQKKREHWQSQFRGITRALGAARDTDVQIDILVKTDKKLPDPALRPGILRLLLRHRQKRARLQTDVLNTLDDLTTSGVLADLRLKLGPWSERQDQVYLYSPALYQLGFDALSTHLDAFLAYESYIERPECIAELHAMRIAAKRLRYTMEALASLYGEEVKPVIQTLRNTQEALGEIHDCDVWIYYLPEFIEKERQQTLKYYGHTRTLSRLIPGMNFFLKDRQERRLDEYQSFVDFWQETRERQVWQNLRQVIRTPFNLSLARQTLEPQALPETPEAVEPSKDRESPPVTPPPGP
jgi:CHAD domain-containing protein